MIRVRLTPVTWGLLAVALCAFAACTDDSDRVLVEVSSTISSTTHGDRPADTPTISEVKITLPRDFKVGGHSGGATVIDQKGRSFKATAIWGSITEGSDEYQETFTATFPVAEDSQLRLLQINEFDVDLQTNRIRRVRGASS